MTRYWIVGGEYTDTSFSVPDDKVAADIDSNAGHRVVLTYEEHRGVPSSCFGDTQYFVVSVKRAE